MAATSTNKQPLLVDHVLHTVVDLKGATVAANGGVDIGGTNNAELIVDSTTADGCVLEDIYAISRNEAYTIKLYLSSANDYLRPQQGVYVGSFKSTSTTPGTVIRYADKPVVLAPVAQVNDTQLTAFYVPKGKALWAAIEANDANDQGDGAPLLGVQGGWY